MKDILEFVLLVINTISIFSLSVVAIFIIFCEFIGFDKGDEFLEKINFPFNSNELIIIGFISLFFMILSYFLKKKFLKS